MATLLEPEVSYLPEEMLISFVAAGAVAGTVFGVCAGCGEAANPHAWRRDAARFALLFGAAPGAAVGVLHSGLGHLTAAAASTAAAAFTYVFGNMTRTS